MFSEVNLHICAAKASLSASTHLDAYLSSIKNEMASAHLKYISRMMISEFNYLNINQNGGGKIVAFLLT